jgi:hypothetical protein
MKEYKTHIIWGIVVVVALAGGFFWGKSIASTTRAGLAGTAGGFSSSTRSRFAGAGGTTGGFTTGQVAAISSSSLTLQLANGNSEVVFYSSSTLISEPMTVPVSDLSSGTNVMVAGTTNSDGSLTAQSIQVRTATMPGMGKASSTNSQ